MSPNNKHNLSEKELDNLLGQAFLNLDFNNPKNQELMESISTQVLSKPALSGGIDNTSLITKLFGAFAAIVLISTIIYFSYSGNQKPQIIANTPVATVAPKNQLSLTELPKEQSSLIPASESKPSPQQLTSLSTASSKPTEHKDIVQDITSNNYPVLPNPSTNYSKTKEEDTNYVFPVLTEKQIKNNNKEKKTITEFLLNRSKSKYSLITPKAAGSLFSNMKDTTAMFYMQNSEVSNFEYRVFLFDLLINNRKKEFLIAKPYQSLWVNVNGVTTYNKLKDTYFSDKRFDEFPVVNISPEGANLFCSWLSELSKKGYSNVSARLPYENEWMFAAKGGLNGSYPWGSDQIQNKKGFYLANFCVQKKSDLLNPILDPDHKRHASAYTSAGFMIGDSISSVYVYSYNPNDYGLFCMSGNVSEMVYSNSNKTIIAKGGSWNSNFEECKINSKDESNENIKASPMLGFRPVFRIEQAKFFGSVERENPETGLPTLTDEETKANQKEKDKMMNALAKHDKNMYALIPMGSSLYRKDTFSVQAFYMQTTEVTNLEYRTFLMDLLIQGKIADYALAKPDQSQWTKRFPYSHQEPMKDLYFSHPAYNDYPVVNISRKAAAMYCLWLTIETNKFLKQNNKPLMNDVRIPSDLEWIYAANNRKAHATYANGNTFLRDSKGRYEMNYMCHSKEECRYDTALKLYVPIVQKRNYTDDGGFHMVNARSYAPNSYGLYCMAGNVSEMVYTMEFKDRKFVRNLKTGLKGGNWFSCDYFLEVDAEDEYPDEMNASPLIGFRPIQTAILIK